MGTLACEPLEQTEGLAASRSNVQRREPVGLYRRIQVRAVLEQQSRHLHSAVAPSSRAATIAPTGEDVQRRQAIAITGVWIGATLQEHAHRLKIASPIASR